MSAQASSEITQPQTLIAGHQTPESGPEPVLRQLAAEYFKTNGINMADGDWQSEYIVAHGPNSISHQVILWRGARRLVFNWSIFDNNRASVQIPPAAAPLQQQETPLLTAV